MATPLSARDAEQRSFWKSLCPALHIEDEAASPGPSLGDVRSHVAAIKREGYMQVPGAFSPEVIEPLRVAVEALDQRGIPLPFTFVFDEIWALFRAGRELMTAVLGPGYRALPDFWVWRVAPADGAAGWGPHRDRVQPTLDRDNNPYTLTVWLPFTDATPLNGCIYVLPAHLDERFKKRVWDGPDNNVVHNPQDIRALPATAGSFLAWNQAILHWGGRASRLARGPRISAAFEFQRGDKPAYNRPLLDPERLPTFEQRLGLVAKQVLQYQHMYPLSPEVAALARALQERYMPGGVLKT